MVAYGWKKAAGAFLGSIRRRNRQDFRNYFGKLPKVLAKHAWAWKKNALLVQGASKNMAVSLAVPTGSPKRRGRSKTPETPEKEIRKLFSEKAGKNRESQDRLRLSGERIFTEFLPKTPQNNVREWE